MTRIQKTLRALALAALTALPALLTSACGPVDAQSATQPRPSATPAAPARPAGVSALGRLEPEHGVITVAAPSTPEAISGSIVRTLLVDTGDRVERGALLATTDTTASLEAAAAEAAAELRMRASAAEAAERSAEESCLVADVAAREAARRSRLVEQKVISIEESEAASGEAAAKAAGCASANAERGHAEAAVDHAKARQARAETELERSRIRAPAAGMVLAVHARPGELVGAEGILDLGAVDRMFAIAEVFETDIRAVAVGQRATVSSEALAKSLTGRVERIRPRVRKQDVVGTDPVARKDARIVEVEIALDDAAAAATLTHLQVDVVIHPGS